MSQQAVEAAEESIRKFVTQFMEHHDACAIRVFLTMKGGGTLSVRDIGDGDIYSIEGFIRQWLIQSEERIRIMTRKEQESEND